MNNKRVVFGHEFTLVADIAGKPDECPYLKHGFMVGHDEWWCDCGHNTCLVYTPAGCGEEQAKHDTLTELFYDETLHRQSWRTHKVAEWESELTEAWVIPDKDDAWAKSKELGCGEPQSTVEGYIILSPDGLRLALQDGSWGNVNDMRHGYLWPTPVEP